MLWLATNSQPFQGPLLNIGNFIINQLPNETRIDYQRNSKDWFDLFLTLILGFTASGFVWLTYVHTHFNKPIFWIVGICFAFLGLVKLADGFFRLVQSSKSVVVISRDKKELSARSKFWKTVQVDFEDISAIILKGQNIATRVKYSTRYQIYMTIQIMTRDGRHLPLLTVNPTRIITTSIKELETDEYEIGQGLAKLVAAETGKLYQWKGFERTYA